MAAGGTSFVAPQLNGLMAVINQRWPSGSPAQPTRQGQANYTFYGMANYEYGTAAAENTSTSAPSVYTCESNADAISAYSSVSPSCVFHNINRTPVSGSASADCIGSNNASCLQDGNVMPCDIRTTNCYTASAHDAFGLLSISTSSFEPAWYQSAGYSDAVGLGSVNIANLVNNWTSSTWITPFTSSTSVTANPSTVTSSESTTLAATVTATGRGGLAPPMGTVSFYNTTSGGTCSGGGSLLGTSALVPASSCTTSCYATASLMPTGSEIGGVGAGPQTITACFSGDGANDATSNGTTPVTVTAPPVPVTASPSSVSFRNVEECPIRKTVKQLVTLIDNGTTDVEIGPVSYINVTGNASDFGYHLYCDGFLGPKKGHSCSVAVTFSPSELGALESATLNVVTSAPGSPLQVPVSGAGIAGPKCKSE